MLRRLYDHTIALAQTPYALWALAAVAFIESSIFPIPPDVMLIPMILAAPHRAWLYAGVCAVASVVGGMAGYAIGYGLFDAVGEPILAFYGKAGHIDTFRAEYAEWGAWAVLFAGLTPFPYKVITIASGAAHLNIWVFLVASIVARGLRFFLVAALLWRFGAPIRNFIERHFGLAVTLGFAVLLGGFALVKVFL